MAITSKELARLGRQDEEAKKDLTRLASGLEKARAELNLAINERRNALLEGGGDPATLAAAAERAALATRALNTLEDGVEFARARSESAEVAYREARDLHGRQKLADDLLVYLTRIQDALAAAEAPMKALVAVLLETPVAEAAQAGAFLGEAAHSVRRELKAIESGLRVKAREILDTPGAKKPERIPMRSAADFWGTP